MLRTHLIAVALAALGPFVLHAAARDPGVVLVPTDGDANHNFGKSMAVSGELVIVGAPGHRGAGPISGAAYLFEPAGDSWAELVMLSPGSPEAQARFGHAVALTEERAVVGAYSSSIADRFAGSVHVFEPGAFGWSESAVLLPDAPAAGDSFGVAVDADADRILVGARTDDVGGSFRGSAHVFELSPSGWSKEAVFLADGRPDGEEFGWSVALDGDHAFVGAILDDGAALDAGAVHVFSRSSGSWGLDERILPSEPRIGLFFGYAVDADGGLLVVGAPHFDEPFPFTGTVWVYERGPSGWSVVARLAPASPVEHQLFGSSVSIRGDRILVGAPGGGLTDAGSAHVFERVAGTWGETTVLVSSEPEIGARMGFAVGLSDDIAALGGFTADRYGSSSGTAEAFRCPAPPRGPGSASSSRSRLTSRAFPRVEHPRQRRLLRESRRLR